MRRAAIVLIVIGMIVVIVGQLFTPDEEKLTFEAVRDNTTIRQTTSGEVVGFRDKHGARAWFGIPYAAPPTDTNRWRAPQPPIKANKLFEALHAGQMCPQFASLLSGSDNPTPGSIAGDEDCLYLNVWAPPNAADLPVMFWIHGGGNSIGHGGSYSGAALATKRNVVVVSLNYRLGIFGWFTHPALQTGDLLDDSGNYGILDLVRGLEWVQNNIATFGGNPGNVTVFGESAGAFDTLAMMASPLAEGLFHRAIVQSGGYRGNSYQVAQEYQADGGHPFSAKEMVAKLLVQDGTVDSIEAARDYQNDMSTPRIRDYLYDKPAADFFAVLDGGGFGMVNLPLIIRDGHVLPDMEDEEIFSNADNHNMVPTILGTNRDEPALFMVRDPRYVENWLGFLPRFKDEQAYKQNVKYGALAWKERGADSLATYMTAAGNPNVYVYRFDWDEEPSQAGFDLSVALGAAHGLEIAFAFDEFEGGLGVDYIYPNDENQFALADSMSSYWSQFAYSGNPGQGLNKQQPKWTPWGTDGKYSIILDTPGDQGIFMDDEVVSIASIKETLVGDSNFSTPQDKCITYIRTFPGHFDEAEYLGLDPVCADINPAEVSRF